MKSKKMIVYRILIVGALIVLQVTWLVLSLITFSNVSPAINAFFRIISIGALFVVINSRQNPAYKLAWAVPILIFPLLGGMMFVFFGTRQPSRKLREKLNASWEKIAPLTEQEPDIIEEVGRESETVYGQVCYLKDFANAPLWKNTQTKYFKSGEENFPYIVEELKKAEHFIFMEYFIIADGRMWDTILGILKEKAAAGLDVRLLYDDVGCLRLLPQGYYETMEEFGIKCEAFNPFVPFVSVVMNNRDHRKILVIDGDVGFTGGINLADEYINEKERFGYWKDTGIMLKGDAVWNLTVMFLHIWNALRPTDASFGNFRPHTYRQKDYGSDGYVQPYGDSPLDFENVGENVYLNIINTAKDYVYMFTPYLIIDNEIMTALTLAAKRGVDVRIVTPHIPDKKTAFMLTQSYYEQLMDGGVKIYEFEPGFIHAKCFVCDDRVATVGTVNLDYRSLYLHFECGVFLYRTSSVMDVKQDAVETIKKSIPVTRDMLKPVLQKVLIQAILKLFAPLF
ncbi:MAG: cardiolipin synthase [Lachnospiraceae bacterium]|nr:cardiolipin synthase [Lachnospiraceae bacterium]